MTDHQAETTAAFVALLESTLMPALKAWLVNYRDPVIIEVLPAPWYVVGRGNFAAVLAHPSFPHLVVKVYAERRTRFSEQSESDAELSRKHMFFAIKEEIAVYKKLGSHPAYSQCYAHGERYLVLRRLPGLTLYDCVIRGIRVEKQVFIDVEQALAYARSVGLLPHDVHGRNIYMHEGRGYVVDVSDFYLDETCTMWDDLKKAYHHFYLPTLYRFPIPIPAWLMNAIRKGYQFVRRKRAKRLH